MEDAIFSYIINNHDLIIKIIVYIGIFLICLFSLVITNKFKDKKQLYYCIRKVLYIFYIGFLLALYLFIIVFNHTNQHVLISECFSITVYSIQIAIICEAIIQIPANIKRLQDNLNITKEQLKNASINELFGTCLLDGRLYKAKNRPNRYYIIYGEHEDEIIKKFKVYFANNYHKYNLSEETYKKIYKSRMKNGYSVDGMKNKISCLCIRINDKLIDNYSNYILEIPLNKSR